MAKSVSPIRLQEELMQAAMIAGQQLHRSTAQQIEYWASLGRSVARQVDPEHLLAVKAGLAQLQVVPLDASPVDPDDVFAGLEQDRRQGVLAEQVVAAPCVRYQASSVHPGQLERIDPSGEVTVGQFRNGQFEPMQVAAD